jgi:hypothetical protein
VGSIDFDTIGVSGRHGDKLSHAFVFTPGGVLPRQPSDLPTDGAKGNDLSADTPQPLMAAAASQVPEPGTSALVLAALAAAGLTARRRQR